MKKNILLSLIVASIMLIPSLAFAADTVGVVDLQKIYYSYAEAQKAQDSLKKKQDEFQKELEKRQEKIEEAKNKKQNDKKIKKLIEKLEKELEPKKEALLKLNQELTFKLKNDIISATDEVAKEYNITVVLDKQVIISGGFDMTDYVLEKLNN